MGRNADKRELESLSLSLLEKLEDWLMDEGTELGLNLDQCLSPSPLSHKF